MASYKAVRGVLNALKDFLTLRMKNGLDQVLESPGVAILGTVDLQKPPTASAAGHPKINSIGIYLHRISVDPFARNRYVASPIPNKPAQPEMPINLHIFLLAWTNNGESESLLATWALQQIGSGLQMGFSQLKTYDNDWGLDEVVQIVPEEMSTEDLQRIWDSLPGNYILSVPYIVKTVRMLPDPQIDFEKPVSTVVTPYYQKAELAKGESNNGS